MITKAQLISLKEHIVNSSSNVSMYLLVEDKNSLGTLKVKHVLCDGDVKAELIDVSVRFFSMVSAVEFEGNANIQEYNPDDEQDLFYINKSIINQWDDVQNRITTDNQDYFEIDNRDNLKIKAWVVKVEFLVGNQTDNVILFQEFQNARFLAAKLLVMFFERNVLKLFDKSIINLSDSMDFMLYSDNFYMLKAKAFERVFSYQDFYKDNAKSLIDNIQSEVYSAGMAKLVIVDSDAIKLKIESSIRLAQKLYSAKVKGYYKNISFKKLESLSRQHKLDLKLDANTKTWTIDDQVPTKVFERIINDD